VKSTLHNRTVYYIVWSDSLIHAGLAICEAITILLWSPHYIWKLAPQLPINQVQVDVLFSDYCIIRRLEEMST